MAPLSHKDSVFMLHAEAAAQRSNCLFQSVGAVLVASGLPISTGCNHTVDRLANCKSQGYCRTLGTHCGNSGQPSRALHAEVDAIMAAYRLRKSPQGCTLYCTHPPCLNCLKVLAAAKVEKIIHGGKDLPDSVQAEFHGMQFEAVEWE